MLTTSPHLDAHRGHRRRRLLEGRHAPTCSRVSGRARGRDGPGSRDLLDVPATRAQQGKGGRSRRRWSTATCEIAVIHDADLEYHPKDLLRIVAGVRRRGRGRRLRLALRRRRRAARAAVTATSSGNRLLTFLCNLVTNLNLTDMETCYKAVRTALLKSIPLTRQRLPPRAGADDQAGEAPGADLRGPDQLLGPHLPGRQEDQLEGRRRGAVGDRALRALGRHLPARTSSAARSWRGSGRAPSFNAWMADMVRPFCGQRVLEIGGGVGNLTQKLVPRSSYVVSDINPLYLQTLARAAADPSVPLAPRSATSRDLETFPRAERGYDTVICLNVIEHVEDDRDALENIRAVLAAGRPRDRPGAAGPVELRHARRGAGPRAAATRRSRSRSSRARPASRSSGSSSSTGWARSPGS